MTRTRLAIAKLDAHATYFDGLETDEEVRVHLATDTRIRREIGRAYYEDTAPRNRLDTCEGLALLPDGERWVREQVAKNAG